MNEQQLCDLAQKACEAAYAPYSGFEVGAALLCRDGRIFTGANIENGAFSPTCCAERVAFFSAIHAGARDFAAIAVIGGKKGEPKDFCAPCGVCRQVMREFCGDDFIILLPHADGTISRFTLNELLPAGFSLTAES